MFLCGMVDNVPRWPWDNSKRCLEELKAAIFKSQRYAKRPKLRQLYTRMSGAFFHKGISRLQAEVLLTSARDDGSFLVRDSESLTGAYVLCLLFQSKVHQYRVLPGPDNKLHVQSETGTIMRGYSDLTELIGEYVKKGKENGLAYALIHPVPPETNVDDRDSDEDEDDDDFQDPVFPTPLPPPLEEKQSQLRQIEKVDLLKNFSKLDLTRCDGAFTSGVKDYVEQGFQKDCKAYGNGETEMQEFKQLLDLSAESLRRELNIFSKKLTILNDLLTIGDNRSLSRDRKGTGLGVSGMLDHMKRINSEVQAIQTKAQETAQFASVPSEYEYIEMPKAKETANGGITNSSPFLSSQYRPYIPQSKFEVKKLTHGKHVKVTLTVDIQNGRYSILKPTSKTELDQKTVPHEKILHLIKSTKDKSSLDVIVDGKKKQTYIFPDPHNRENFCIQIRQMKTMHSIESEPDQISVFVGTWNMGDTTPNQSLSTWLRCTGNGKSRDRVMGMIPHDLYVIGTQESAMTEKDWINTVKAGLKACVMLEMELVEVCTMWGIRLAVLCKQEHKSSINRIQRASVRTGIANALGNKGAVAISFYFQGTSFCFINAHLTSGDERVLKRNQNYRDIVKSLSASLGQKHLSQFDITNQFHHVFWLGDLNYRLEENVQVILQRIKERDIPTLMEKDQMRKVQRNKEAFGGFQEAEITFLPTYRLERNCKEYKYAWRKIKATGERINVPSWCDRVMWRSYPEVFIENVAYGSSEQILSSDHRPVFSSFNVGILSEFVQSRGSLAEMTPVKIVIHSVEAEVKTCCKQFFQLEFHSTCLQEVCKSKQNLRFNDNRTSFNTVPVWETSQLPELKPLFSDQEYLEEQHILVAVVSRDDDHESYGECVLPLKTMFGDKPKEFEYILLHQGEEAGKLRGKMHVISQKGHRSSSRKAYSLVTFDTEYRDPELFNPDKPRIQTRREIQSSFVSNTSTSYTGSWLPGQGIYDSEDPAGLYESIAQPQLGHGSRRAPAPLPTQVKGQVPVVHPRNPSSTMMTGASRPAPSLPRQSSPQAHLVPRQSSTQAPTEAPPPIPSKVFHFNRQDKPETKRLQTLEEWLATLNLSCYETNFIDNGWDSLMFMSEMTQPDLTNIGIVIPEHQDRILNSIKKLGRK